MTAVITIYSLHVSSYLTNPSLDVVRLPHKGIRVAFDEKKQRKQYSCDMHACNLTTKIAM